MEREELRYYKFLFPDPCSLWLVCFKCGVNNRRCVKHFAFKLQTWSKIWDEKSSKTGCKTCFSEPTRHKITTLWRMFKSNIHTLWTDLYIHTVPHFAELSNGRRQSTFQERTCCFIRSHQENAVSGFKMKTKKSWFHCREQKDGEKEKVVREQWMWSNIVPVQIQHFGERGRVTVILVLHRNEVKYFCY